MRFATSALQRKLLRDLWHLRGQALAITLVIGAGVAMFVMSHGMLDSLTDTRAAYYERYRFAHIFASAVRAPEALVDEFRGLPGVMRVESRVRGAALFDVPGHDTPISGQLLSRTPRNEPGINDLVLTAGRALDPARGDEILLLRSFADAHGLRPGDQLHALVQGVRRPFRIVGVVLSPEFIYAIAPGEMMPDAASFGVAWMNHAELARALDLDGAFNEVLLLTSRSASTPALIDVIDRRLEAYGGRGAHGRDRQLSDQFLSSEIQQLEVMGLVLPPIFLLVAAFLLNVVIGRLVEMQREQIGVLKAFGYTHVQVAMHFMQMSLLIAAAGCVLGAIGGHLLGARMAGQYMQYFQFPFLLFSPAVSVYVLAIGISLLAAILGGLRAAGRVARLHPAAAMQAPAPADYSHDRTGLLMRRLDQPNRMILRHLRHRPGRAGLTVCGMAMAMGLLIGSSFSLDALDLMIDISFNLSDRQDASLSFVEARPAHALNEVRRLPGVLRAEPFRVASAELQHRHIRRQQSLIGLMPDADLSRLVDEDGQSVELPADGLVLSAYLADSLDIRAGDRVRLHFNEGRQRQIEVPVVRTVETFMGSAAWMSLPALNRALGESDLISGAHLSLDPRQEAELSRRIKRLPAVAGLSLQRRQREALDKALQDSLGSFIVLSTLFAGLIAVGVIYNAARVSLSERGRELASLRVLGLRRGEVSWILLAELGLLTLLALPLGALFGYGLASGMIRSLDTELFRMPLVIEPATVAYAALVVLVSSLLSGLLIRHRIHHLDLIAVLKTRE